jgi:hypothetical protein
MVRTGRALNPGLLIVARAEEERSEPRLLQAGATRPGVRVPFPHHHAVREGDVDAGGVAHRALAAAREVIDRPSELSRIDGL